jgi:formylglycine-generating enzyme required for sulfatase activity
MLPRRTFRKRVAPLVALVLGFCTVNVQAQEARRPYSKEAIVGLLKGEVSPKRVAVLARQRGIDFQITFKVESELRRAGATAALLATLREIAPKPPTIEVEMVPRVVSAPAAVAVRENPKDGLKYAWIPPGTFIMGCSPGDSECGPVEKPAHQVTITKGFWIGQTEVTVAAYRRFVGSTGAQMPVAPDFNANWNNQDMPIVDVSWNNAKAFCGWARGRLPTEAQWEYAARAGSTEARYGPLDEVAWYSDNSGQTTHEVGQKRANGFGLYDVLGNVWEWVSDWYDQNYYQNSPAQDPTGATSGNMRVLRGGAWNYYPSVVRVSNRVWLYPTMGSDACGFRCAREVDIP